MWEYLDKHPIMAYFILGTIIAVILFLVIFVTRRVNIIWKFYQEAKQATDPDAHAKAIKKKLKKGKHSIAFVADNRDNQDKMKKYKDFINEFCEDKDQATGVVTIGEDDVGQFEKKLFDYTIVVYKVFDDDIPLQNAPIDNNKMPLYWELTDYCCYQQKNCVLLSTKYLSRLDNLDNYYFTTVNYYSKLRETLHNLLYFAP